MEALKQSAVVFLGGGIGAWLRYVLSTCIQARNPSEFPWGTFVVNISGAFLIGFLLTVFVDHFKINPFWRFFSIAGILGGYTTFSALSWETVELYSTGAYTLAAGYVLGSVVAGVLAVACGIYLGRLI